MRLPEEFRKCVAFLGLAKPGHQPVFKGTGFFVGVHSEAEPTGSYLYFVTARHCVELAAQSADPLVVRINTANGGSRIVSDLSDWHFPENDAVDLAVHEFDLADDTDHVVIDAADLATEKRLTDYYVGIGDEVGIVGLFHSRSGKVRNLPVLRSGTIASMPEEPFEDETTGLPYDAYLIELRSFGGLSGSPVFVIEHRGSVSGRPATYSPLVHRPMFIGIIRGHWDEVSRTVTLGDPWRSEAGRANLGLALGTPISHLLDLLFSDEFVKKRRLQDARNPASG